MPQELIDQFKNFDAKSADLVHKMLCLNPTQRITSAEALRHPYFLEKDQGREMKTKVGKKKETRVGKKNKTRIKNGMKTRVGKKEETRVGKTRIERRPLIR